MKDLKRYYCKVKQEQANEARELLVKAGETICKDKYDFIVKYNYIFLQLIFKDWFVGSKKGLESKTELTYPQFREMLIEKIKNDANNL